MRRQGFTLIEVLIVIAIIGILAAIGIVNLSRWRATSAVMEGAQQFAQAVSKTRTEAKRTNACRQISLAAYTDSNTQYQVKEYSGAECSTATGTVPPTRTYTMPPGTRLVRTNSTGAVSTTAVLISFRPPYGTTDSSPDNFEVRWTANTDIRRTLRITSIFGKVVIK